MNMKKSELRQLIREMLQEELIANARPLKESVEGAIDKLKDYAESTQAPWYTEYFAVGPAVLEIASGSVLTPEDFGDDWTAFEEAMNDPETYEILPVVFGPSLTRAYSKTKHATLEDALDYTIDSMETEEPADSYKELFDGYLMDSVVTDEANFVVAYGPDVQDCYGCFMRVSQKPLGSNQRLGKYLSSVASASGKPHILADMMDTGLVSDDYSLYPNFNKTNYAWQAK